MLRGLMIVGLTCAAAIGAGACTGSLEGPSKSGEPAGPPPPTALEPKNVPTNPTELESVGGCVPLDAGQRLVSVSPEGHAWVIEDQSESTVLTVFDPFDPSTPVEEELDIVGIESVRALSDVDGAVVAGDGLWRLEGLARIQVEPPEGFAAPASLCGDVGTNGFMLSAASLYERRHDQWWSWASGASGDAAPSLLLTYDGECSGSDNSVWTMSPDGVLWKVDPAEVFQPTKFDDFHTAVATETGLVVLAEDQLFVGPDPWQPWVFSGQAPAMLSASGDAVWMVTGGGQKLLRLEQGEWASVTHLVEGPIEQFIAHPGGIWLVGEDQLCHQALLPMVRVEGLRPYARTTDAEYDILLQSNEPEQELTVTLDGEPVELEASTEVEGWFRARGNLGDVGWHRFELSAGAEMASSPRSLPVKVLPLIERSWAEDIAPIFEANCTGSVCHSADATGDAPPMATYEDWLSRADKIRTNVVLEMTMPPPDAVGPDWGPETIEIISEWLEGGMLP